ncbi:hypothetical protein ABZ354_05885 [Streptomyces sp. NPDC005925]|uniref:hypothetical protein n=1 Tax=Streptomyces sp. NPDC005925 TaxID=3157172 RepID=UPI0033F9BD74
MSFDAIFNQPEIIADLNNLEFEVTTYPATATRTGSAWVVSVHDLPDGRTVQTEGSTYREAEDKIQELVPEHLGVDRTGLTVSVEPADLEAKAALRALTGARIARAEAEQAERDAAREAARLFLKQGWPAEDIGTVLRLPVSRVSDLVTSL